MKFGPDVHVCGEKGNGSVMAVVTKRLLVGVVGMIQKPTVLL
jgi:hypothetical protein